jgi:hypothetical protein
MVYQITGQQQMVEGGKLGLQPLYQPDQALICITTTKRLTGHRWQMTVTQLQQPSHSANTSSSN